MSDIMDLDLVRLAGRLRRREVSAREVVEASLARIGRFDPALNAFREVYAEDALAQARSLDESGDSPGQLFGVPVAVKDNIDIVGRVTRSGFGARGRRPASEDAAIVRQLRESGAIILGHTNMHEGALGATTDNPHHGRTHNPHRLGATPGGSSGGSAAAVAVGFCPLALGTDTLGSIRLPAAYCGIVGFKASHGRLSNDGVEPLCGRFDQVGPMARSVADLRLVAAALEGRQLPPLPDDLSALRVGRLTAFDEVELDDDVRRAFENSLYRLHLAEIVVTEMSIDDLAADRLRRAGLLLAEAEAAARLKEDRSRYPNAFSENFAALLDYGAGAGEDKLASAHQLIDKARQGFDLLFEEIDLLIAPTAPQTAFSFDDRAPANQADLTALANIAGAPAISLPILSVDLPVGLQIIGPRGADDRVLSAAAVMERDFDFRAPPLILEEML